MWKFVFLLSLLGTDVLASPTDLLQKLISKLEKYGSTYGKIYKADSDSDRIAVALDYDKAWGDGQGKGFIMSMYYGETYVADKPPTPVFKRKTWDELADFKVDWGWLKGKDHAVSIEGLEPGTSYHVYTVTEDATTDRYLGYQETTISTEPGKKALDEELKALITKLEQTGLA